MKCAGRQQRIGHALLPGICAHSLGIVEPSPRLIELREQAATKIETARRHIRVPCPRTGQLQSVFGTNTELRIVK